MKLYTLSFTVLWLIVAEYKWFQCHDVILQSSSQQEQMEKQAPKDMRCSTGLLRIDVKRAYIFTPIFCILDVHNHDTNTTTAI